MVYIVVLNWKNAPDTIACLHSLFKLQQVDYRIVVCDNHSPDDSYQQIRDWLQQQTTGYMAGRQLIELNKAEAESYTIRSDESGIYLIQTGANLGFAGGNNVGVRFSLNQDDMNYVWILNNDTEVDVYSLSHLVNRCMEKPSIGICGSRLVYFQERQRLQGVGGCYNRWLGTTSHYAAHAPSDTVFNDDLVCENIDYVIGASMLVSRDMLNQVGLLREDYFLYFEELDYCFRARQHGLAVSISSNSIVFHKEGASTGKGKSILADYYSIRNRVKIASRYSKVTMFSLVLQIPFLIINRLRKGNFVAAVNVIAAFFGGNVFK